MPGFTPARRFGDRYRALLAVLVINTVPILGVSLLGWSLTALVLLYWFELAVTLVFATIRAVFAQRPPEHPSDMLLLGALGEKRWHLPLPGTSMGVLIANVSTLSFVVPVLVALWLFPGLIGLAGIDQATAGETVTEATVGTALLAVPGIIVGRGVETYRYFAQRRYAAASVQRALKPAASPIAIVGTALLATGMAAAAGAPPTLVLGAVVATKLGFDLAAVFSDRLAAFDERSTTDFGWASEPPEWPAVDTELSSPVEIARPRRAAVLLDGVLRGLLTRGGALGALLAVGFGGLGVATGSFDLAHLALLVGGGILSLFVSVGLLDRSVRYLPVEYRIGGDVVCYDRVADRGQWRIPGWTVPRAERRRTLADRLFGTCTLVLEHGDRTLRIAHVPPEALPKHVRE